MKFRSCAEAGRIKAHFGYAGKEIADLVGCNFTSVHSVGEHSILG